jgi:hypothetical protein
VLGPQIAVKLAMDQASIEGALRAQIADLQEQLTRARELAVWFRDEQARTLPVVVSFRWWRMGHQDTEAFHKRLLDDDCGRAIGLGPVVPMQAMSELNDWLERKDRP